MGDLAGWPYWKVVSITGQSGAGTDYQAELEIGDSAGGNFHLEGHCTNFPQDIRITDDDGTTLLDYWVEDLTADPIVVHVKVNDDLGSNRDVRVYYGKSGETTVSNIDNTFIFGDDGSGDTVTDKYNTAGGTNTGVFSYSNGELITSTINGTHTRLPILDSFNIPDDVIVESRMMTENVSTDRIGLMVRRSASTTHYVTQIMTNAYDVIEKWNPGQSVLISESGYGINNDVYYIHKFIAHGTSLESYTDGTLRASASDSSLASGNIGYYTYRAKLHIDWMFARKYNSPEPTFSSAGAEQTPTVGAIMNQFQRANIGADLYNGVFA